MWCPWHNPLPISITHLYTTRHSRLHHLPLTTTPMHHFKTAPMQHFITVPLYNYTDATLQNFIISPLHHLPLQHSREPTNLVNVSHVVGFQNGAVFKVGFALFPEKIDRPGNLEPFPVEPSGKCVEEGRFPGPAGAHDGQHLPGLGWTGNAPEDLFRLAIGSLDRKNWNLWWRGAWSIWGAA